MSNTEVAKVESKEGTNTVSLKVRGQVSTNGGKGMAEGTMLCLDGC